MEPEGFSDNLREAATARLPWAPEIFHARITGFGQVRTLRNYDRDSDGNVKKQWI